MKKILCIAILATALSTGYGQTWSHNFGSLVVGNVTTVVTIGSPYWVASPGVWRYPVSAKTYCDDIGYGYYGQGGMIPGPFGPGRPAGSVGGNLIDVNPGATYYYVLRVRDDYYNINWDSGSMSFTAPAAPKTQKKITVSLYNQWDCDCWYRLVQNGKEIGRSVLSPGQRTVQTLMVYDDTPVSVEYSPVGYKLQDGSWVASDTWAGAFQPGAVINPQAQPSTGAGDTYVAPPPTDKTLSASVEGGNPAATTAGAGPIWVDTTTSTSALPVGTYKEGVGILDADLKAMKGVLERGVKVTGGSGSGGGGADYSAVLGVIAANTADTKTAVAASEARNNTVDTDIVVGRTAGQNRLVDLTSSDRVAATVTSANASASAMGTAAGTAAGDGTFSADGSSGTAPADTIAVKVTRDLTIQVPKNPFSSSGPFGGVMAEIAVVVRRLIAWGLVAAFFMWAMGRIREMCAMPFATAPFGSSLSDSVNSVRIAGFGGGLGYAVRLAAFALVLTTMLTLPVAVMAGITSGLPWSDLKTLYALGPGSIGGGGSGMLSQAWGIANVVVPWSLLMAMPGYYVIVEFVLFPSQLFWTTFVKFLPL